MMNDSDLSSPVQLNVGGKEFCTTIDTLTRREPGSKLAAMFSGRDTLRQGSEEGYIIGGRDGKHFRHILNWLRDGVVPTLTDAEYSKLLREAEYYQLLGLIEGISSVLIKRKEDEGLGAGSTHTDIIKGIQSERVKLQGVNLCGLDLSKSGAKLSNANLKGANLQQAYLSLANLKDTTADLTNANLEGANLEGANLKGANLSNANLKGANLKDTHLEGATLYGADLRGAKHLEGANLDGANLLGAIW